MDEFIEEKNVIAKKEESILLLCIFNKILTHLI